MILAIDQLKKRGLLILVFPSSKNFIFVSAVHPPKRFSFKFKCNDFEQENLRISKYFEFHGHVCCKNKCSENKQPDYVDITWFVGKNE